MRYLDQLENLKTHTKGTVLTAKSPLDSKGSSESAHYQKTVPPLDSKGSTEGRRFQKTDVAFFCHTTCPGLESIDLPGEGEVVGCVNPTTGAWRRLDWLSTCPAAPTPRKGTPPWPPLVGWCDPQCDRFHVSGGAAWCCNERDERHWSRRRISSMESCPATKEVRP